MAVLTFIIGCVLGVGINPWVLALNNGLGRTPAMGYNTWNAFYEKSAWLVPCHLTVTSQSQSTST